MIVYDTFLSKFLGTTLMAIALGNAPFALAQGLNAPENAEELVLPTGNSQDLEGLEERRVNDWFPQNGISEGQSETLLEINEDSYRPSVNDPDVIRNQEKDWRNNTSGDPKQSGAGIPLGEF